MFDVLTCSTLFGGPSMAQPGLITLLRVGQLQEKHLQNFGGGLRLLIEDMP